MRPLAAKRLRKILEGVIIDGRKEERKLEMRENRKKNKKKKTIPKLAAPRPSSYVGHNTEKFNRSNKS